MRAGSGNGARAGVTVESGCSRDRTGATSPPPMRGATRGNIGGGLFSTEESMGKKVIEEIAAQDEASKPQVKAPKPYGRPLAEILADLSKPIAPQHLESKKKGGTTLLFIPWHRAIRYLDYHAPGWSYEVRAITPI